MYIILLILDNILKLRNASKILSINLNFVRQFLFRYLIRNWLHLNTYINNMSISDGILNLLGKVYSHY